MSELPSVSGREAIKAFGCFGFELDRIKGSHHILKKPENILLLTVPVHASQALKSGTLRGLIRSAGITVDEFTDALGSKP